VIVSTPTSTEHRPAAAAEHPLRHVLAVFLEVHDRLGDLQVDRTHKHLDIERSEQPIGDLVYGLCIGKANRLKSKRCKFVKLLYFATGRRRKSKIFRTAYRYSSSSKLFLNKHFKSENLRNLNSTIFSFRNNFLYNECLIVDIERQQGEHCSQKDPSKKLRKHLPHITMSCTHVYIDDSCSLGT